MAAKNATKNAVKNTSKSSAKSASKRGSKDRRSRSDAVARIKVESIPTAPLKVEAPSKEYAQGYTKEYGLSDSTPSLSYPEAAELFSQPKSQPKSATITTPTITTPITSTITTDYAPSHDSSPKENIKDAIHAFKTTFNTDVMIRLVFVLIVLVSIGVISLAVYFLMNDSGENILNGKCFVKITTFESGQKESKFVELPGHTCKSSDDCAQQLKNDKFSQWDITRMSIKCDNSTQV